MEKDFYKILGVEPSSTTSEIKKAYRKVAMKCHPDKNPGNKEAENTFKAATEAYNVLSDSEKRQKYDQFGHEAFQGGGQSSGGSNFYTQDFNDFFKNSPFGSFFEGGSSSHANQGSDLRIKIKVTLHEIAKGVEKNVKIKRYVACGSCSGNGSAQGTSIEKCTHCKGSGAVRKMTRTILGNMVTESTCFKCNGSGAHIRQKCANCHGDGRKHIEDLLTFKIPAGVRDSMELTLRGKGNAPIRSGESGNLIVQIDEVKDELLQREGNNICYTLHLSFMDASLGCEMEVPTIYGQVRLKIAPGTQSGRVLKLKGKGVPALDGYASGGDQLVFIQIWTPQELTKEEKDWMVSLRSSPNFIPRPSKKEQSFFERVKSFF